MIRGKDFSHLSETSGERTSSGMRTFDFQERRAFCLRPGVVQNQHFWGPHGRQFAPSWAGTQKNPEKTIKNVLKNGAKWRFFGGPERHFAMPAADGLRSQISSLTDFTSMASDCIEPAAAPEIGG